MSGSVSPEEKNEMELLATLAWPASEAELLEIPSVEEGTVVPPPPTPPPRPSTASTHYTQTTD